MEVTERVAVLEQRTKTMEDRWEKIEGKIDRMTWYLVLTVGGVATSTILLFINLKMGG